MGVSNCDLRKAKNEAAAPTNQYNQNFHNRFCENEPYEAESEQGTMYQCLLGACCGEDWFHDRCIISSEAPGPESRVSERAGSNGEEEHNNDEKSYKVDGFPDEDDFEHFICWRCVSGNPWLLDYIGTPGFLNPVIRRKDHIHDSSDIVGNDSTSRKRKAASPYGPDEYDSGMDDLHKPKIGRLEDEAELSSTTDVAGSGSGAATSSCKLQKGAYRHLASEQVSIFLKSDFRESLCHCPPCLEILKKYPYLLREEDTYEPPLDDDVAETAPHETLFDAGEKALGAIDRVRAIEGVMAYNILKEKVRSFLLPFAEEKRIVSPEDVKKYFEDLKESSDAAKSAATSQSQTGRSDNQNSSSREGQEGTALRQRGLWKYAYSQRWFQTSVSPKTRISPGQRKQSSPTPKPILANESADSALRPYYRKEQLAALLEAEDELSRTSPTQWKPRKQDPSSLPYFTDLARVDPFLDLSPHGIPVSGRWPTQPVPQMKDAEFKQGEEDDENKLRDLSHLTGLPISYLETLKVRELVSHRVTNQTRLGKIAKQYVLTVAGDGNGMIGIGEASSTAAELSTRLSQYQAIKNMKPIVRYEDRTIYGNVEVKLGAVEVSLMSRPPGVFFIVGR
ncbi:hypothetical protein ABW19_dt0206816 [Dactylella cylindrospora]|nr:hypothetical protein ABW19_dt0206816 [Dactylella cylindrospora]